MQLSEAIRLGDTMIGDKKNYFLMFEDDKPCGCALGSALFAIGANHDVKALSVMPGEMYNLADNEPCLLYKNMLPHFPILALPAESAHYYDCKFGWNHFCEYNVFCEISAMHSNGVSRESIAEWVEQLEQKHPELRAPEVTEETLHEATASQTA